MSLTNSNFDKINMNDEKVSNPPTRKKEDNDALLDSSISSIDAETSNEEKEKKGGMDQMIILKQTNPSGDPICDSEVENDNGNDQVLDNGGNLAEDAMTENDAMATRTSAIGMEEEKSEENEISVPSCVPPNNDATQTTEVGTQNSDDSADIEPSNNSNAGNNLSASAGEHLLPDIEAARLSDVSESKEEEEEMINSNEKEEEEVGHSCYIPFSSEGLPPIMGKVVPNPSFMGRGQCFWRVVSVLLSILLFLCSVFFGYKIAQRSFMRRNSLKDI